LERKATTVRSFAPTIAYAKSVFDVLRVSRRLRVVADRSDDSIGSRCGDDPQEAGEQADA
jgi:hypothetical protein